MRVAGVVLAIILVNVLIRFVPLPDVPLPAVDLPELPGWLHTVLKVKNVLVVGFLVAVVLAAALQQAGRRPGRER